MKVNGGVGLVGDLAPLAIQVPKRSGGQDAASSPSLLVPRSSPTMISITGTTPCAGLDEGRAARDLGSKKAHRLEDGTFQRATDILLMPTAISHPPDHYLAIVLVDVRRQTRTPRGPDALHSISGCEGASGPTVLTSSPPLSVGRVS